MPRPCVPSQLASALAVSAVPVPGPGERRTRRPEVPVAAPSLSVVLDRRARLTPAVRRPSSAEPEGLPRFPRGFGGAASWSPRQPIPEPLRSCL